MTVSSSYLPSKPRISCRVESSETACRSCCELSHVLGGTTTIQFHYMAVMRPRIVKRRNTRDLGNFRRWRRGGRSGGRGWGLGRNWGGRKGLVRSRAKYIFSLFFFKNIVPFGRRTLVLVEGKNNRRPTWIGRRSEVKNARRRRTWRVFPTWSWSTLILIDWGKSYRKESQWNCRRRKRRRAVKACSARVIRGRRRV